MTVAAAQKQAEGGFVPILEEYVGFKIMQLCPHCGNENYEGVIYCERCGVALVAVPLATRQLEGGEEGGGTDSLSSEGVLILQVGEGSAPILVQMRTDVILGRLSQSDDKSTYLNLTPYGADDAGVSRRHARLMREGQAVYLTDLNSTNGTRLNGEPLPASVEKRLRDGDEIMLGRLKVYAFFKS